MTQDEKDLCMQYLYLVRDQQYLGDKVAALVPLLTLLINNVTVTTNATSTQTQSTGSAAVGDTNADVTIK